MKNEQFDDLLKCMQEMDRIVQGELAPGRVTRFTESEVKLRISLKFATRFT